MMIGTFTSSHATAYNDYIEWSKAKAPRFMGYKTPRFMGYKNIIYKQVEMTTSTPI